MTKFVRMGSSFQLTVVPMWILSTMTSTGILPAFFVVLFATTQYLQSGGQDLGLPHDKLVLRLEHQQNYLINRLQCSVIDHR